MSDLQGGFSIEEQKTLEEHLLALRRIVDRELVVTAALNEVCAYSRAQAFIMDGFLKDIQKELNHMKERNHGPSQIS